MSDGESGGADDPLVREYDAEAPSEAVVGAVAAATGRSPLDLPPLFRSVEADALDAAVGGGEESVRATFSYAGCRVALTGDHVRVESGPAEGTD